MSSITKFLLLGAASIALVSCATVAARLPNQGNIVLPVEMRTYRINLPDKDAWKDWEASQNVENDTFIIKRLRKWPLTGEVQGFVTIMVARNTIAPEGWNFSEAHHADQLRIQEEKIMRERGPTEGNYEIEIQGLTKNDLVRNGKKLYAMTWTASQRRADLGAGKRILYLKGAMYLYFPEAYNDTHAFYQFVITDAVIAPSFFNPDAEQIYPILDSFSVK